MKKRRNQLILKLLSKKADPYKDENVIDFRWSSVKNQDEVDIALANFIESLQKQVDEKFFYK